MKNSISIEVTGVSTTDFNKALPAPQFVENNEEGINILFDDIDLLRQYQNILLQDDQAEGFEQRNAVRAKINVEFKKALHEHQIVLNAIKAYAERLFRFIFNAEGHRKDRLNIFDTLLAGIDETANSYELEKSIKDSTFELGILPLDHRLTFMNYAHNQKDYSYNKIKSQLITELKTLRSGLLD